MGATPSSTVRSFWAAAICLPAFAALRLQGWASVGAPERGVLAGMTAELIGYAVAWAGFALISLAIADMLGKRERWPRLIAAWNFTNVVQYLVLLAGTMLPGLLGLPGWLGQGAALAALGYALWLEWFVVRAALALPGASAAGLVMLDLVFGLFVSGLVARVAG